MLRQWTARGLAAFKTVDLDLGAFGRELRRRLGLGRLLLELGQFELAPHGVPTIAHTARA